MATIKEHIDKLEFDAHEVLDGIQHLENEQSLQGIETAMKDIMAFLSHRETNDTPSESKENSSTFPSNKEESTTTVGHIWYFTKMDFQFSEFDPIEWFNQVEQFLDFQEAMTSSYYLWHCYIYKAN